MPINSNKPSSNRNSQESNELKSRTVSVSKKSNLKAHNNECRPI